MPGAEWWNNWGVKLGLKLSSRDQAGITVVLEYSGFSVHVWYLEAKCSITDGDNQTHQKKEYISLVEKT